MKSTLLLASLALISLSFAQDTLSNKDLHYHGRRYHNEGQPYNGIVKIGSEKEYKVGKLVNGQYHGIVKTYKDGEYCCQMLFIGSDTIVHYDENTLELKSIDVFGEHGYTQLIRYKDGKLEQVNWKLKDGHHHAEMYYYFNKFGENCFFNFAHGRKLGFNPINHQIFLTTGKRPEQALEINSEEDCLIRVNNHCYETKEAHDKHVVEVPHEFTVVESDSTITASNPDHSHFKFPATWTIDIADQTRHIKVGEFEVLYDGTYHIPELDALEADVKSKLKAFIEGSPRY